MQQVPDRYREGYDHRSPHQGRCVNGRTPAQAFVNGIQRSAAKEEKATIRKPVQKHAA
jgi:hypothetical protein